MKLTLALAAATLVAFMLGFAAENVTAQKAPKKDPKKDAKTKADEEIANKVFALLTDKCSGCHGGVGAATMGRIGYITDYERVTERLVNKERPEDSKLYEELNDGSMPKERDAGGRVKGSKKLPQADIDNVLNWIKAGAPRWRDPNAPADTGQSWAKIEGESPSARKEFMLSEGPRGTVVLFGGLTSEGDKSAYNGETWVFAANKWAKMSPKDAPAAGASGAIAFDKARNTAVFYGGICGDTSQATTTWEWNGTNWSLQKTPANPGPRVHHAMAFDPVRKMLVLFGGADKGAELGDTWQYDGKNWTQVDGDGPAARGGHSMAYDPATKSVLLYGGAAGGKQLAKETWLFDGKAWKKQAPTKTPGPGDGCAMATGTSGVILAGGYANGEPVDECWKWDGKDWTRVTGGFGSRANSAMATDSKGARYVLFGGIRSANPVGDTWAFGETK